MSAEEGGGAGQREVAYRAFAAEYDDADYQYTENEADDRAPNYVVTPGGARANRLFVVGVLTEVERVNEDMLRGRIVDPTGAFVVYAGQYQPDALTALERLDPPAFVAVTGKARTFQPEDAETVYTSVRPESINEVDADTRDRWTVGTARHTLDRAATFADALEREERGEELTAALEAEGVDDGVAAGIPLAIDHYGTTTAYLDALRETAIEAAEVVAGEREEVSPLDLAPDEGGHVDVGVGSVSVATGTAGETTGTTEEQASADDPGTSAPVGDSGSSIDEPAEPDSGEPAEPDSEESEGSEATIDEMYELDEAERERVETEFGTEFSTGSEIEEPGEADIGASEPSGETDEVAASADDSGTDDSRDEPTEPPEPIETAGEPDGSTEEPADDVDLEDAVVDAMRDLDSGDGADRDAVIEAVSDEHGVDPVEVEDAIQDALMSGTCYEPGDGLLKAI
mgnify:CR=1 FL=1